MKLPAGMVARCDPDLLDLPENPTIQSTEETRKRLSDALADWMTRGNMRHEDKPDPRLPTPEQIEAARKSILEAEDERILAEMRQANVPEWDESVDPKKLAYPDGTPEEHARKLGALIKATLPADDPRKPEDLVCGHASSDECECVCHADPPKGIILHDHACCSPCGKCGFRIRCSCPRCNVLVRGSK